MVLLFILKSNYSFLITCVHFYVKKGSIWICILLFFYCSSWVWQRYGNTILNQWSTLWMNLSSCWVETERMTLEIQAAMRSFLCSVCTQPWDKVRSSDNQRELGEELLLLHVERSQLRWFNIWSGSSWVPSFEVFWTSNSLERLCHSSVLGTPWISQEELENIAGERDTWTSLVTSTPDEQ